jgi:poly-beta-1,6-N-acetyl-D-glucosamine N-deacetylase
MAKLKNIASKFLYYSGIPLIIREVFLKHKITIILLHDPEPEWLDRLFIWLKRNYNIISLDEYIITVNAGTADKLPPKSLIITFDDGHSGNYRLLPVIKKYNMPVTIFICSGIVGTKRHYWFKFKDLKVESDDFKTMPDHRRQKLLSEIGFDKVREMDYPQALTEEQICEMKGHVNFQSHTVFHPVLTGCSDEESWIEISTSKSTLESNYKLRINAIAFPNGNYGEREIDYVRKAGYECALTAKNGYNSGSVDLFRLKRIGINDKDNIQSVSLKLINLWFYFKRVYRNK